LSHGVSVPHTLAHHLYLLHFYYGRRQTGEYMSAGDSERREWAERLDAPFWVKAWYWFVENPWDWLWGSKWGIRCIWIIFSLYIMLSFWWVFRHGGKGIIG